jgi:hypothetical protein
MRMWSFWTTLPEEPEYGREFRAIPTAVQSIENNLSIANMDFEDFAEAVDEDGVFRGFQETGPKERLGETVMSKALKCAERRTS